MDTDVLVVGAGPTGLALAIHLALRDVRVRIVDAADHPATTSRALGLQPRGAEVLERIGALGDLPGRSQSALTISYNDGPRTVLRLDVGRAVGAGPKQALIVSQAEVEAVLRRRLHELGGEVEWSTRLVGVRQDADRVVAAVRAGGGEQHRAVGWLIGCDGAHSTVRKAAGIAFPGRPIMERLLMVDVHARWPYDRNGSTTWMDAGRMLSVTALPGDLWRVFSQPPPDLPDTLSEQDIADRVLTEFSRRSGMDPDTVTGIGWASEFRIQRRLADTYRRGRILLAGDAAHVQSPTGGQGQNTGLGDAENLGWKLALVAGGRADPRLLDTYEAERRPLARRVLRATTAAVSLILPHHRWERLVRDLVLLPALRLPAVQRRLWLAASQLGTTYRGGPLTRGAHRWSPAPRPGDRVADLRCRGHDGVEVTLHAAVAGRWAVLAGDEREAVRHADAVGTLVGAEAVVPLVVARMRPGRVLLVRPDGHLAWRGRPGPEKLTAWLTQILWPAETAAVAPATPAPTR